METLKNRLLHAGIKAACGGILGIAALQGMLAVETGQDAQKAAATAFDYRRAAEESRSEGEVFLKHGNEARAEVYSQMADRYEKNAEAQDELLELNQSSQRLHWASAGGLALQAASVYTWFRLGRRIRSGTA